jgi:hypothetical protein
MNIHYERSGGFTGLPVKVSVDTKSLPDETANRILEALSAARFFELPERLSPPSQGADQFIHRLSVEDETRHHAVEMADSLVPDQLQPVLRQLVLMARKQDLR